MQQRSKFIQRTSALALAAVLALGMGVQAAGPGASTVDDRREDLTIVYETLKDSHPDLFANTPEETFLARKAELTEHLDSASDVEFLFGLQSLAALVGDSHTSVQVADSVVDQLNAYPMVLSWRDGHWYLTTVPAEEQDLLGAEVTAIGGRSMAEVVETFGRVLSADNPVKLRRQYRQVCNVADYYAYLGLAKAGEPLALTLADGKTVSIAPMPYLSLGEAEIVQLGAEVPQPATARQKCNYCALPLSGQVYYIQYNVCQEDPALPMEDFAAQVQADLEAGGYSRVLVDLRNNGGGSDGVIWPLLSVLRQEMDDGTEVVGLIGEATFSSAIINAVELQEMGIPLVGEPASGSVDHFGSASGFSLPNSGIQIGVSSKYIDLGTLLDADAGPGYRRSPNHGGYPGGQRHRCGVAAGPSGDAGTAGIPGCAAHPGAVRGAVVCCGRVPCRSGGGRFPGSAGHRVVPAGGELGRGDRRHRRYGGGRLCGRTAPHLAGSRRLSRPHCGGPGARAGGCPHRASARCAGGGCLGPNRSGTGLGMGPASGRRGQRRRNRSGPETAPERCGVRGLSQPL